MPYYFLVALLSILITNSHGASICGSTAPPTLASIEFDRGYELYEKNRFCLTRKVLKEIRTALFNSVCAHDAHPELIGDAACLLLLLNQSDLCLKALRKFFDHPETTPKIIEVYQLELENIELEASKENISKQVNVIEMWLTLNEPFFNGSEIDQVFYSDEQALSSARTRLEALKVQLAEYQ
jgi:hypothetical protein